MSLFDLLAADQRDFIVVKAHAASPNRLFVAVEAYVHATKAAATSVLAVDLESLAVEVVHEIEGSSVDYLHVDGWHGILRRDAVIEVAGATVTVTDAKLGAPTSFGNQLTAIGRVDGSTFVCGTKSIENHMLDGFVARVADRKLVPTLVTSKVGQPGPMKALATHGGHVYAASGTRDANFKYLLFRDAEPIPVGTEPMLALHAKADGSVMIGGDTAAWIFDGTSAKQLPAITMQVAGAVELHGVEYWISHDKSQLLQVWKRGGEKPVKAFKSKFQYPGYRSVPEARITAAHDRLLVTNKDRIHIFDGKTWSQLALQANAKKPFKRLPAAMKK